MAAAPATAAAATALARRAAVFVRANSAARGCGRVGRATVRRLATSTRTATRTDTTTTTTRFSRTMATSATAAAAAAAPAPVTSAPPALDAAAADAIADGGTIPGSAVRVFRTVAALRAWRQAQARAGRAVGLVPTMGALHAGHAALVRAALAGCDAVVVSVYVNPTQFGAHEDLGSYPRTWAADCETISQLAAEAPDKHVAVFAPTTAEMYPSGPPSQAVDGPGSYVTITPAGAVLEGASRPTFFRGVATVCMKLFHIAQPARAYFGQKDVQQAVVLRRLVRDFHVPLALVVAPTVREPPDGLARSSRNVYLGARRRAVAGVLRRALVAAEQAYASGTVDSADLRAAARRVLDDALAAQLRLPPARRARFEVDYVSVADPDSMAEVAGAVDAARGAILSGAIRMLPVEDAQPGEDLGHSGGPAVRLIDNIVLGDGFWESEGR